MKRRVDRITPASYRTEPGHKNLADRIMAAGNLDPGSVREIIRIDTGWDCVLLERDVSGRIEVTFDGEVRERTVHVPFSAEEAGK